MYTEKMQENCDIIQYLYRRIQKSGLIRISHCRRDIFRIAHQEPKRHLNVKKYMINFTRQILDSDY